VQLRKNVNGAGHPTRFHDSVFALHRPHARFLKRATWKRICLLYGRHARACSGASVECRWRLPAMPRGRRAVGVGGVVGVVGIVGIVELVELVELVGVVGVVRKRGSHEMREAAPRHGLRIMP